MKRNSSFVIKVIVSLSFLLSFSTPARADIGQIIQDFINSIIGSADYGAIVYAHSTGHGTVYIDGQSESGSTDDQAVAAKSTDTANDPVEFVLRAFPDTGYKFDGWDDSNPKSGEYESEYNPYYLQTTTASSRGSSSVIPLYRYAFFSLKTYFISSSKNGGDGDDFSVPYTIESSNFNIPPCPYTRDGYTFTGWNLPADEGSWSAGNYSDQATVPKGSYGTVTLVAQWQEIPKAAITINVTGGLQEGETILFSVMKNGSPLYTVPLTGNSSGTATATIKNLETGIDYIIEPQTAWSWTYSISPSSRSTNLGTTGYIANFEVSKNTGAKKHDEKVRVNWKKL